jgi:hypothetical protein
MGRFPHDDDDDFKDELGPYFDSEYEDDEDEESQQVAFQQVSSLDMIQLDLVEMELNQRLLDQAIQHCQNGIWWYFMGEESRQNMIDRTFARFRRLVTLGDSSDDRETDADVPI